MREQAGITREEAGYVIRASGSKISRLELGRTSFKLRDVNDLLSLYGVHDDADRATPMPWPGRRTPLAGGVPTAM